MSFTGWLLLVALIVYVIGRRRSRTVVVICAQLIGAAALCVVLGQIVFEILRS